MDKIQKLKKEKEYEKYVNEKTPRHNVWLNMLKAFLLGGAICTLGQIIYHYCEFRSLSTDECSSWTSTDACPDQCASHRNGHLSPPGEMGRRRSTRPYHRICQLRSRPCH